jgi:DNA-binding transcriptional MerR regulator
MENNSDICAMESEKYVNINEARKMTGVVAVTLRAWERRYGLIKPKRTPKGHRLYSPENIEQIKQINKWLDRGVAISKVATLLASGVTDTQLSSNAGAWQEDQQKIFTNLIKLKQVTLSQTLDGLNKSMRLVSLCEKVYQPLLDHLEQRWQDKPLGYQLEQQLWQQCWQRQMTIMTLRADKQKPRANCWLVNVSKGHQSLDYGLFYALLIEVGVQVNALNELTDLNSLPRLKDTQDSPLIIFGHNKLSSLETQQLVNSKAIWHKDLIVVGSIAEIHHDKLEEHNIQHTGGKVSVCWQSDVCQAWLEMIQSALLESD